MTLVPIREGGDKRSKPRDLRVRKAVVAIMERLQRLWKGEKECARKREEYIYASLIFISLNIRISEITNHKHIHLLRPSKYQSTNHRNQHPKQPLHSTPHIGYCNIPVLKTRRRTIFLQDTIHQTPTVPTNQTVPNGLTSQHMPIHH